jgi:hypothetical protein
MSDERGTTSTEVVGESVESVGESCPFIDSVLTVLADWHRREICKFFVETDAETATVEELAMLVAGCRPATAGGEQSHEAVVAELTETHLPCLAASGVVDYDSRSGRVRYWGQPTLEKWLEHISAVDQRQDCG